MHASFSLKEFLDRRSHFSLGVLTTESFHPLTKNLSYLSKNDLNKALLTLQKVDSLALEKLLNYSNDIYQLHLACMETLSSGGRIFISGCGATGRLALSLEKIANESGLKGKVFGFMAGGDYALIKSVESFEDRDDFGVRQLQDLGFSEKDLLLGVTEGGETSFVLGTINFAKDYSHREPYFVYCNPDEDLKNIERSKKLIDDNKVRKLNLSVGEMALSGSTRMQATTVQMLSCGIALFNKFKSSSECESYLKQYCEGLLALDVLSLKNFILKEADQYQVGGIVTYLADSNIAIAVMTDTTERSPTFNLPGFEKVGETDLAMSYLCISNSHESKDAWNQLLGREPKALTWVETQGKIDLEQVYLFDISQSSIERRNQNGSNEVFKIGTSDKSITFEFCSEKVEFELKQDDLLFKHLCIKVLLNMHSTLIMGILGRYEDNMMTYVKASNLKLVDRAIRYASELLKKQGIEVDDGEMAQFVFDHKDESGPIVIKLRDYYLKRL